ncbi:MAG: PorT family protein [Thermoflexibacter sp.]|nr:PorT family protein [Thermoflexibacter sp.]
MKKLFLLLLLIVGSHFCFSQQKLLYGFTFGANFANARVPNTSIKYNFLLGYNVGMKIKYHYLKRLYLVAMPMFSQKGFSDEVQFTSSIGTLLFDAQFRTSLKYLSVPLLINWQLSTKRKTNSYVLFGGEVGYLIRGSSTIEPTINSSHTNFTKSASTNRLELSGTTGIGIETPLKNNLALFFEFRYIRGLTAVINQNNPLMSQVFALNSGLMF